VGSDGWDDSEAGDAPGDDRGGDRGGGTPETPADLDGDLPAEGGRRGIEVTGSHEPVLERRRGSFSREQTVMELPRSTLVRGRRGP